MHSPQQVFDSIGDDGDPASHYLCVCICMFSMCTWVHMYLWIHTTGGWRTMLSFDLQAWSTHLVCETEYSTGRGCPSRVECWLGSPWDPPFSAFPLLRLPVCTVISIFLAWVLAIECRAWACKVSTLLWHPLASHPLSTTLLSLNLSLSVSGYLALWTLTPCPHLFPCYR